MFRKEKFVQQPVDLQKPLAIDANIVPIHAHEPPIFQSLDRLCELLARINFKLLREVLAAYTTKLELQDEFTNVFFLLCRNQRTEDRQFPGLDFLNVRIEIMMVLVMCSTNMPERGHSQRKQIRPRP